MLAGIVIVALHGLFFAFVPAAISGNLHWDTLEAIYWGSEWEVGYAKHPPVATWLFAGVLRLAEGRFPIFAEFALSQLLVAVAAYYVWRAARLFLQPAGALDAVVLFLISPIATVYSIQANHNSALVPFWAAAQYFGLAFLSRGRTRDALGFGLAAGLGLLTKYELSLLFVALAAAAIAIPDWRARLWTAPTLAAIGICLAIVTPHVLWLAAHDWPSVGRALGPTKMTSLSLARDSLFNALAGQALLFTIPAFLAWRALRRVGLRMPVLLAPSAHRGLALRLALVPSLMLLVAALATWQLAKPLWTTPFAPSIALAGALALAGASEKARITRRPVRTIVGASAAILGSWLVYLGTANALGDPVLAYAPDTRRLAAAIDAFHAERSGEPLACLVIDDHQFGPSYLLWARRMPSVVDLGSPDWQGPERVERCRRTGGVYVAARRDDAGDVIARERPPADWICSRGRRIVVQGAYGPWRPHWTLTLFEVPRAEEGCPPP